MKMKGKHTPHPWEIQPFIFDSELIVRGKNYIAAIGAVGPANHADKLPLEQVRANTRLIAASPELFSELVKARRIISNALNLMTTEQQIEWGRLNARDGVDGEGCTRAHERDAVIAKVDQEIAHAH